MTSIAAAAKVPPKFVVKAIYDYKSASPIELSIQQGDFFLVTSLNPLSAQSLRPPPTPPTLVGRTLPEALRSADVWIEVTDPARNLKGVVPTAFVDILERTGHAKQQPASKPLKLQSPPKASPPTSRQPPRSKTPQRTSSSANAVDDVARTFAGIEVGSKASTKTAPPTSTPPSVYPAVVQYDFNPEQLDELRASAGDNVLVLAHSGLDWVVAKFIDKLGNPGMIPVNFLLIRDPATNQPIRNFQEVLRQGNVLTYKQWRAKEQSRSQRSISLGVLSNSETGASADTYKPAPSRAERQSSGTLPVEDYDRSLARTGARQDTDRSSRSAPSIISVPPTPLPTHSAASPYYQQEHGSHQESSRPPSALSTPSRRGSQNTTASSLLATATQPTIPEHHPVETRGLGIGASASPNSAMLKIKVVHGADIMAIRCNPETITRANLMVRIATKLFQDDLSSINRLLWRQNTGKGNGTYIELDSEDAFHEAVRSSAEKMLLYVQ